MTPLIDSDIFLYEVGFGSETGWKYLHPDSVDPPPFQYIQEMLDGRVQEICNKIEEHFGICNKPILYLTGKGNFREKIAKKNVYKGNRKQPKPFHYANIKGYLQTVYGAVVVEGMEADDAMCIEQTLNNKHKTVYDYVNGSRYVDETIICTRDKDLRMCPGWHYGWELGKQAQYGPLFVSEPGEVMLSSDKKKIVGNGSKFFFSQLITGDMVDNIAGIPGNGPVEAYKLLSEAQTYEEMEKIVSEAYRAFYGDAWKEEMREQAQLLWMIRELDEEGNPVMWKFMDEE